MSIDTLRADALGAYGNARAETPWIDRLAHEGVRFADVHAHNVVTLPSHVNMLTGLYPWPMASVTTAASASRDEYLMKIE